MGDLDICMFIHTKQQDCNVLRDGVKLNATCGSKNLNTRPACIIGNWQ